MTDHERYMIHGTIDELLASKEEGRRFDPKRVATRANQAMQHERMIMYARDYRKNA